jgi:uncharacterized Zn-finger protein
MADDAYAKFRNDNAVPEIRIGIKEFKCIGVSPPHDHPYIYLDMGSDDTIRCCRAQKPHPGNFSPVGWNGTLPAAAITAGGMGDTMDGVGDCGTPQAEGSASGGEPVLATATRRPPASAATAAVASCRSAILNPGQGGGPGAEPARGTDAGRSGELRRYNLWMIAGHSDYLLAAGPRGNSGRIAFSLQ